MQMRMNIHFDEGAANSITPIRYIPRRLHIHNIERSIYVFINKQSD